MLLAEAQGEIGPSVSIPEQRHRSLFSESPNIQKPTYVRGTFIFLTVRGARGSSLGLQVSHIFQL